MQNEDHSLSAHDPDGILADVHLPDDSNFISSVEVEKGKHFGALETEFFK